MPYLLYDDNSETRAIRLESLDSGFTIGRGPDNNLRLREDSAISRKHCLIFQNPASGDFFLRDLESSNGTFANGNLLSGTETRIEPGNTIALGSITFTFMGDDKPPCEYDNTSTIIVKAPVPDISAPDEYPFKDTAKLTLVSPVSNAGDVDDVAFPTVEGFELIRILGGNNYSTTYLAFQTGLKRTVALKMFHTADIDDKSRTLFIENLRNAGSISHRNLVPFFDAGIADGLCFTAMSYATGGTLRRKLDEQSTPIPEEKALEQILPIIDALRQIKDVGIIHANISPSNIIYNETGEAMLADTGLSQWLADVFQTERSSFFGRTTYMPPEQTLDRGIDWTCDQYALGVLLFEMMTGNPPFKAPNSHALIEKHIREKIRFPAAVKISDNVKHTIAKMMAKKKEQRFPSWQEIDSALRKKTPKKTKDAKKKKNVSRKNVPLKQKSVPKLKKTGTVIPIASKKRAINLKRK